MAGREFKPKLSTKAKPDNGRSIWALITIVIDTLKLRTRILLGALIQIALCAALPMKWAVVPAGFMLLNSIVTTIIQVISPRHDPYVKGFVPGRATAQIPSPSGVFGPKPGDKGLVVFNIGIQWNHPLGVFSPGGQAASDFFQALAADLHKRREELGFLGMQTWKGAERESNNTLLQTLFFRDVESLHRFAHEDLHRKAWDWYQAEKRGHLGIYHETYCVPAGGYETMYVNCRPLLFGAGEVKGPAGKEAGRDGEWLSTLVSADTPALKTQYARLGRYENGTAKEIYE